MASFKWVDEYTCCNPFEKSKHSSRRRNLRTVNKWMCEKMPSLSLGSKICDDCRRKLARLPTLSEQSSDHEYDLESSACSSSAVSEESFKLDEIESRMVFNQCMESIGETPFTQRKVRSKGYLEQKMRKITTMMAGASIEPVPSKESETDSEIIQQLKEKFQSTTNRADKLQVLTVLPKSWSIRKIEKEFGATNYMVRKAKQLVLEKGVLSSPNPKPGHSLPQHTVDVVTNFYESDEVSRMMPGKKDFVSVKRGEGRVHIQKRLVLCNLRELYMLFKDTHPTECVGFSKFAELRPKQCVLAGASGTHSVCVCTIHQNVKLMIIGSNLSNLSVIEGTPTLSYKQCLATMICNPPLPRCYLKDCNYCPGIEKLKEKIIKALDDEMIDNIVYKQWLSVDRSTLETLSSSPEEFVDSLCEKLEVLLTHSFIATQQSMFYKECRASLKQGEMLVTADFAENYAFVLQDAAQSFHWNNDQATIHPFVVYFKENEKQEHLSYVAISNCLKHDTVAVYQFQKKLIAFLKTRFPYKITKMVYFSDGAASQYKNRKNFINLCHHEVDFGVPAEWHFSATSHGKSACDGIGGTVKRLAARASLQMPYENQIMTAFQLFQWATENITQIVFTFCTSEEHEAESKHLEERFKKVQTIAGTRKFHSFSPLSEEVVRARIFSTSKEFTDQRVSPEVDKIISDQLTGYVTCVYDQHWWVAYVQEIDVDNSLVTLKFLHPHGPSASFRYPQREDILTLPIADVLTVVNPRTATGRVYTLSKRESQDASEKLGHVCQKD